MQRTGRVGEDDGKAHQLLRGGEDHYGERAFLAIAYQ